MVTEQQCPPALDPQDSIGLQQGARGGGKLRSRLRRSPRDRRTLSSTRDAPRFPPGDQKSSVLKISEADKSQSLAFDCRFEGR